VFVFNKLLGQNPALQKYEYAAKKRTFAAYF